MSGQGGMGGLGEMGRLGGMDLLGALAAGQPDPSAASTAVAVPVATGPDGEHPCSRRGCTAAAVWALEWNNPRVHTPDRVKTWLACPEHRAHLEDFLDSRGFLRRVRPLHEPAAHPPHPQHPATDV